MFHGIKYLIVSLVFFPPRFLEWESFSDCALSFAYLYLFIVGSVLFLIFINGLPDNIMSSVRLFADDCALYRFTHEDSTR